MMEILQILKKVTYYKVEKRKKNFIGPLNATVKHLASSNRNTGLRGFAVTLETIFDLSKDLYQTEEEPITKFCTYILQQDFIESFFSLIRLHGGWDDNPAPAQIKYIMRKLIVLQCGGVTPSLNTNCIEPPSFLECDLEIEEDDGQLCMQIVLEAVDQLDEEPLENSASRSHPDKEYESLKKGILAYIAGNSLILKS